MILSKLEIECTNATSKFVAQELRLFPFADKSASVPRERVKCEEEVLGL